MFSVTVDNVEYKVEFRHFSPNLFDFNEKYVNAFGTMCFLFESDNIIETGSTHLHPLDLHSYNRNVGRKLSLHRSLHNAFPGKDNKETRRKFWQAYYEVRGEKW